MASPLRGDSVTAGSYNAPSEFFPPPMSPTPSSKTMVVGDAGDLLNGIASPGRGSGSGSRGNVNNAGGKVASSFPRGGFDLTAMKASSVPASELTTVSVLNVPLQIAGGPMLLITCIFC